MRPPDAVVVAGPPLSGAGTLVGALRSRLADHPVREIHQLEHGRSAAVVVFVLSAAAPITGSDLELLDVAARDTDAVVAVVSKIDVHRNWREVLAVNRIALARHRQRYLSARWTGVAADPQIGPQILDELVDMLSAALRQPDLAERNRLRDRQSERELQLRDRRREHADRAAGAIRRRGQIHYARMQLAGQVRASTATLRAELNETVGTVTPRRRESFRLDAARRAAEVAADVDRAVSLRLGDLAADCGLPPAAYPAPSEPPAEVLLPPVRRPALENRLTALLGAGFGAGVALTLGRVSAGLIGGWTPTLAAGCVAAGVGLGSWVGYARCLLSDRAGLERWVAELTVRLRAALEERVAARVLEVEIALGVAAAERDAPRRSERFA